MSRGAFDVKLAVTTLIGDADNGYVMSQDVHDILGSVLDDALIGEWIRAKRLPMTVAARLVEVVIRIGSSGEYRVFDVALTLETRNHAATTQDVRSILKIVLDKRLRGVHGEPGVTFVDAEVLAVDSIPVVDVPDAHFVGVRAEPGVPIEIIGVRTKAKP